jgi:hypothetical protein
MMVQQTKLECFVCHFVKFTVIIDNNVGAYQGGANYDAQLPTQRIGS